MSSAETSAIPMPKANNEYNSIQRAYAIPLVQYSLETVINVLNAHSVTRYGYATAKDVSSTAFKYTEPHIAPILVQADGLADRALVSMHASFPAAFETKPEDISNYVRGTSQSASEYVAFRRDSASKVIDERVKAPAFAVVEGVDRSCTPLVNALENVVTKFNPKDASVTESIETKYQYQRALALSKNFRNNVYGYSTEQWNELQAHNTYIHNATETAHAITKSASSSIASVQQQVQQLSTRMIQELQQLRTSTLTLAANFQENAATTYHNSASHIQSQKERLEHAFRDASATLGASAKDMGEILKDDLPLQEKAAKIASHVQETVKPLLQEMSGGFRSRGGHSKRGGAAQGEWQ